MRRRHHTLAKAGLIAVAAAAVSVSTGCSSSGSAHADRGGMPSTRPANAAMFAAPPRQDVAADGMIRGSLAYPTGDRRTSAILLEKAVPAEVLTNKPYAYELTVQNISSVKLDNVEVTENLPAGLKLSEKVEGAAAFQVQDGVSHLLVGTLQPGERKTFKVNATATAQGAVTNSASVTYDSSLTLATAVVQPSLTMTKTLPSDVLVCDKVPLKISLSNNGTGTARNVKLEDFLPEGMTTADGKKSFSVELGNIGAGETKNIELPLSLSAAGAYKNTAIATADDGLRAEATAVVAAHQAILELAKSGPKQQYVGVPYTYEITVTNKGDADATNVVVTDTLPVGLVAVNASDNARVENGRVVWNITKLAQGESKPVKLVVKGMDTGTAHNTVVANADCATTATVSADTNLVGVPAISIEVIDDPDPIAIGGTTNYNIVITNQGTAPATNVRITGELEAQMEYVTSKGVTNGTLENSSLLRFDPLASLAPKAKAMYTVTVKAKDAGDVRFKTTLTSDQLTRPVEELESSTFYK